MSDLNKVLLIGRVTVAPCPVDCAGYTQFTLHTCGDIVRVAVPPPLADGCLKQLLVGKSVYVEGSLRVGEVVATSVTFINTARKEPA